MAPTATFYYSALDFGDVDYTPVQNATRTANHDKLKEGVWMVPLYLERDRLTSIVGYIAWNSVATTTDDGDLAVTELLTLTTGNKTMMAIDGFTNSNGYYQVGEKVQALLTQGSLSPAADKSFTVSKKKFMTIERDPNRTNWRKIVLSTTVPN